MRLCVVDGGPRGTVDDHVRPGLPERATDGGGVGNVEIAAGQASHLRAVALQKGKQVLPEHAAGSRDQPSGHCACPPFRSGPASG